MFRYAPTVLLALMAGLLLSAPAAAQVIVQYNFDNTTATSTSAAPSSSNANVMASSTVSGPNIVQDYSLTAYPTQVLRAEVNPTTTPDEASAVSAGTYWSFTVTPNATFMMNPTTLTFDVARGGDATPRTWYLYSSVGGFTLGNKIASTDVPTVRPTLTPTMVDLSASQFQGLTGPVEFRMYISTPGNGQSLEFDNVSLNGSVLAVPEPTSLALVGLAVSGWALRRRWR
jgi:hypothetical protein